MQKNEAFTIFLENSNKTNTKIDKIIEFDWKFFLILNKMSFSQLVQKKQLN
jgi:hypothetical protein